MKLALTSAILFDMKFCDVLAFLKSRGIPGIEPMCWPVGSGDKRKFAGVTHIDVTRFGDREAATVYDKLHEAGITISGLGYYPNPLTPVLTEAKVYINHIRRVISAAERLGVPVVNTFVGRDWTKSVEDNWPRFFRVWKAIVGFAEDKDVKIAIENCPMKFTLDEWPGGKNLANSPAIWRHMFEDVDSPNFGLNLDPSHLVLQRISDDGIVNVVREFGSKIFHVHAKDLEVDQRRLDEVGVFADKTTDWHTPKIPGRGQVPWKRFFLALKKGGYDGFVSIEVEDPDFKTLEERQAAVVESQSFLESLLDLKG